MKDEGMKVGDLMALAVHEALKLKALERFKLVAGLGGLDRKIKRVGIIDHEEVDQLCESIYMGEFLISNLLIIRDQPEMITAYIREMIAAQAACLAIKTIYFDSIPPEAIELADEHQFPVFIFDETYIDTLVVEIDKALNMHGHEKRIRLLIDQVINSHLNEFRMREMAYDINRNFKQNYIVYYATERTDQEDQQEGMFTPNSLSQMLGENGLVLQYREGYLIIASYDFHEAEEIQNVSEAALKATGLLNGRYQIGCSQVRKDLGEIGSAINESLFANDYAVLKRKKQARFSELSVYQLLIPLRNDSWVHRFYKNIIQLLIDHDAKQGTELLNTAIAFIKCEGDMQATAQSLYQHTNTIRYRVRKIAKLLGEEHLKGIAYEALAMAIRLYMINTYTSGKG